MSRRLIYRLVTTLRGEGAVLKYLREIRSLQRLPEEELARRQDAQLLELLAFAGKHNRFHRQRGVSSDGLTADNVRRYVSTIEPMSRLDLQQNVHELTSEVLPRRVSSKSTGGSTGQPVKLIKDSRGVAREMAASWMALEWFGIGIADRGVRFWGTPLTAKRRLRFRLADFAMNRIRLSAFDLHDDDLAEYWERCIRFQPRWFYGYASLIHMFAEFIDKRGLDGRRLGLRAIVPTSEPLTTAQRETITRVYGAPIQNEYGCGEVGAIAYECERGLLHILSENLFVEVLDSEGREVSSGETGEVVVTDLTNTAMPLIRYRVGDYAVKGAKCSCGRSFPTLAKVWGRIHDVLYTPAGNRWHGEKLDYLMVQLFGDIGGFTQYQVVQDGPDTLDVRLVSDQPIPDVMQQRIRTYVRERLDGMRASVRRVDSIERSPSGKLRLVRNDWLATAAGAETNLTEV